MSRDELIEWATREIADCVAHNFKQGHRDLARRIIETVEAVVNGERQAEIYGLRTAILSWCHWWQRCRDSAIVAERPTKAILDSAKVAP